MKTIREAVGQAIAVAQQWGKLVYIVDEEPNKPTKKKRFETYVWGELPDGAKVVKFGKLDFDGDHAHLAYTILRCLEANGGGLKS